MVSLTAPFLWSRSNLSPLDLNKVCHNESVTHDLRHVLHNVRAVVINYLDREYHDIPVLQKFTYLFVSQESEMQDLLLQTACACYCGKFAAARILQIDMQQLGSLQA